MLLLKELEEACLVWQSNKSVLWLLGNNALGLSLLLLRVYPYGLSRKYLISVVW